MSPVRPRASSKALTCISAFCPVLPSITSSTSWGALGSAFCTTRLILRSSSIRCSCVGRRPAVSTSTTSLPRALPALTASKHTEAGSPPVWCTISTVLRSAQTMSCSRAAARKVSAAASSTLAPSLERWCVSLPMLVVLPAPLTPATMITVGCCAPMVSGFSSGLSSSASASTSSALTAAGSVVPVSLTRRLRSSSRNCVAFTPASAISSASSSCSYSASSMRAPVNTVARFEPVLRRPARSLPSQPWRAWGAEAAAGVGSPVGPFFLKRLNIQAFLQSTHSMKHLLTAFLALAVLAPAPAQAQPRAQQSTLANGMTLIVQPDRRAPTVAHMVWLRVGSMDEVDGASGVAHVLEHMLFKGTKTLQAGEFSRRVAALGGRENAFTSLDYTGYFQQIPASRLEDVMKLEADRFAHNRWPDAEFTKEIEVVKEERRLRTEDNPRSLLYETLMATAYTASPYRRPIVGWMSDLDSMTPDDARDFYRKWYVPANAVIVVVGDVDPAQVKRLAERHYGAIPPRAVPARKPRIEPQQAGLKRVDLQAPAEQAYVTLAFKVPGLRSLDAPTADDDDALALTVLAAVLDGYSGARLDRALTQGQTVWPTAPAPATACWAAARRCSSSTACPPRARPPPRWKPPCASRWRASRARA
jgi:hypothetical protein